jgi:hypothetical protein
VAGKKVKAVGAPAVTFFIRAYSRPFVVEFFGFENPTFFWWVYYANLNDLAY